MAAGGERRALRAGWRPLQDWLWSDWEPRKEGSIGLTVEGPLAHVRALVPAHVALPFAELISLVLDDGGTRAALSVPDGRGGCENGPAHVHMPSRVSWRLTRSAHRLPSSGKRWIERLTRRTDCSQHALDMRSCCISS